VTSAARVRDQSGACAGGLDVPGEADGRDDRASLLVALERDHRRVDAEQRAGGFERACEHLVEVDRRGDIGHLSRACVLLVRALERVREIGQHRFDARRRLAKHELERLGLRPASDEDDHEGEQQHGGEARAADGDAERRPAQAVSKNHARRCPLGGEVPLSGRAAPCSDNSALTGRRKLLLWPAWPALARASGPFVASRER